MYSYNDMNIKVKFIYTGLMLSLYTSRQCETEWGFIPFRDENHKRTMDDDHTMSWFELNLSGISNTKETAPSG